MHVDGVGVSARAITARGPAGVVFESIDAEVAPGGLLAVCGAGGCGKTAFLLALSGRLGLVAGRLEVGGFTLPKQAASVRRLVALARVRPGCELTELLRVREVLREQRTITGVDDDDLHRAGAQVGIDPHRYDSTLVAELPPDDQLLLAVTLAAADEPPALVVDDVDAGLPPPERRRAWSALRAVAATGCTVLASAVDPPADEDGITPVRLDGNGGSGGRHSRPLLPATAAVERTRPMSSELGSGSSTDAREEDRR